MLQIQYVLSSSTPEATQTSVQFSLPPICPPQPRRRLRVYLVGSPEDTQNAVDRLHLAHFAERIEWSRPVQVTENGIIIRPDAGDVLRYMQRSR